MGGAGRARGRRRSDGYFGGGGAEGCCVGGCMYLGI